MNEHLPSRKVSLFRNGRNQAVRIPVEFEMPGTEAKITKDGDRLILEPQPPKKRSLKEVLDSMEAFPDFPDVDDSDLPPLRDIDLSDSA